MMAWCRLQDYKTLYATMKRIADAEARDLDTWNIGITAGDSSLLAAHLPPLVSLAMVSVHRSQYACYTWLHMLCVCQSITENGCQRRCDNHDGLVADIASQHTVNRNNAA